MQIIAILFMLLAPGKWNAFLAEEQDKQKQMKKLGN